jgi:Icc-related predicted phosphoesterase
VAPDPEERIVGSFQGDDRAQGEAGPRRRVAAVGDLHCREESRGVIRPLLAPVERDAEVLALCGDLTDRGTVAEAEVLAGELQGLHVPLVGVLGNHDYETDHADQVRRILVQAGVHLLDGDVHVLNHDLGFAGTKGFGGGFGDHLLQAWGEAPIKEFVRAAIEEEMKLEGALAKLRTRCRIVLLHYAPMRGTCIGEPSEVIPFLGTSRLQVPINRYHATVVFHGHAHRGTHHDRTNRDVPVYNVALPLLRRETPPRNYAVLEL